MKVICVDSEAYPENLESVGDGKIEDGEVYEVIDVYLDEDYIFYELSIDEGFGYWENCFARCSNTVKTIKKARTIKEFIKEFL